MVVELILNGETLSTQSVPATDARIAKKQALAAALKAGHMTISQSLLVTFIVKDGNLPAQAPTGPR